MTAPTTPEAALAGALLDRGEIYAGCNMAQVLAALRASGWDAVRQGVVAEIATERRRQIEIEDWTPEHDDQHSDGEIAYAAAAYIRWGAGSRVAHGTAPADWPWAAKWWKPKNRRRDLIRAAALLVAEIERLDRAADRIAS